VINNNQTEKKKTHETTVKLSAIEVASLKSILMIDFHWFIEETVRRGGIIVPRQMFGNKEVDTILKNINHICGIEDINKYIGGKLFLGQAMVLMESLKSFLNN
jgi:hypothetical protein